MCFRYVKPDKDKRSKFKTSVKKRTLNPEYNEVMSVKSFPILLPGGSEK